MCGGAKGQSTQTTSPNPAAMAAYTNILGQAQNVASTPYQPYTGQLTAPLNDIQNQGLAGLWNSTGATSPFVQSAQSQQGTGFNTTSGGLPYLQAGAGIANSALPYYQKGASFINNAGQYQDLASGLAQRAAGPLQFQQYESPYTQQVVNATQAQFNNQNAQSANNLLGSAIKSGNAFGGDRAGVAQAALAGQEQTAQAPVIAGLENQGFQNALQAAENQAGQQNTAAGTIAGLGSQNINAGSAYGNLGAGTSGVGNTVAGIGSNISGVGNTVAGVGSNIGNLGNTQSNEATNIANIGNQYQAGLVNSNNALLAGGTQGQNTSQAALNAA